MYIYICIRAVGRIPVPYGWACLRDHEFNAYQNVKNRGYLLPLKSHIPINALKMRCLLHSDKFHKPMLHSVLACWGCRSRESWEGSSMEGGSRDLSLSCGGLTRLQRFWRIKNYPSPVSMMSFFFWLTFSVNTEVFCTTSKLLLMILDISSPVRRIRCRVLLNTPQPRLDSSKNQNGMMAKDVLFMEKFIHARCVR